METILFVLGIIIGLQIIPIWILGVSILLIKQLSDDPKNPDKPYFFTAIEPGRIKAVLLGGKVVKYLMNFPGHYFPWELTKDETVVENDESWEVKKISDTLPPLTKDQIASLTEKYEAFNLWKYTLWFLPRNFSSVFSWYKGVVFRWTGHRWVGLYPFQTLHIYRFNRKVQKRDQDGRPQTNEQGLPVLEDSLEMTDHVRARTFVRQSSGQEVETQEGLKVKVTWMADVYTTNPQKALFGSDRWDVVLDSVIIRALASNTRTMPVNQILTAEKGKAKTKITERITSTKDALANDVKSEADKKLVKVGLRLETFNIVDFEANFSEEDLKALTAKWRAERNKEAARIEGEGRGQARAAEITTVAEAIRAGGEEAKRAQELEAQIATAEAVGKGGGVAIIGSQNGGDAINVAILAELKKLNEGKK